MVGYSAQDEGRKSARVLFELLWPVFTPPLANHLGRCTHCGIRYDAMGAESTHERAGKSRVVRNVPLHEWDDIHNSGIGRCLAPQWYGTLPGCSRGGRRL